MSLSWTLWFFSFLSNLPLFDWLGEWLRIMRTFSFQHDSFPCFLVPSLFGIFLHYIYKPHNICSICSFCFLNEYCADLFSVHWLRKQQSWSQLRLYNDASDLITLLCICVCCAVAQNSLEELIFLSNFPDAPAFSQIQPKITFSASIIKRQSDHK